MCHEIRNDERTSNLKDFLIQRKCFPIGGELCNTACLDGVLNSIVSKGQPMLNLFLKAKTVGEIPTALHFINFEKKSTNIQQEFN